MESLDLVSQPTDMHDTGGNTLKHHFSTQARINASIYDNRFSYP